MKIRRIGLISILIILLASTAFAESIYIAQNAAGTDSGADCSNAHSVAWFNTAGNWGIGDNKISAGDTVHLCGTITTALTVQGSGSAGSPITILWENGAKVSLPYGTLLTATSKSYLVFDGGTNGILENTDNGDGLTYQQTVTGVVLSSVAEVELKNLTLQNLYVKQANTDVAVSINGITFTAPAGTISIHNNTFNHICWVINTGTAGTNANLSIYNNTFSNYDHGIAQGAGFSTVNTYNNSFGPTSIWDSPSGNWHHDGVHVFFSSGTATGYNYYNNIFTGDWGSHTTCYMFFECTGWGVGCSNFNVYNNVFLKAGTVPYNGFIAQIGTGFQVYNNTLIGNSVDENAVSFCGTGIAFKNNLISGVSILAQTHGVGNTFASGGLNNNLYAARSTGGNAPFQWNGNGYSTFSQWQAGTSGDSSGVCIGGISTACTGSISLNANGSLPSGSPAIGAGFDLSGVGIAGLLADYLGISRPQDGTWDIGAYEFNGLTVTAFVIPSTYDAYTVPITTFTATDDVAVTGYCTKENATTPGLADSCWSATPQTSYTFGSTGSHNLYAWAKDGDGNISASAYDSTTITMNTTVIYTTSGTWTVPEGVTTATVECWGGGGGGANRTTNNTGGGGGGGGAYAKKIDVTVTPGAGIPYVVGAAGAGGASPGNGGDSSFNATTVVAKGGRAAAANSATGGAGGLASASTGDVKYNGGIGFTWVSGSPTANYGAGGGGSGGSAVAGINTAATNASSNLGASAVFEGGPGGAGASGFASGSAPTAGPGGGGGGARKKTSGTMNGGAGYAGQVRITWPIPNQPVDTTPPVLSNGLPYGSQACTSNPLSVVVSLATDETATCKWTSLGPSISYANMGNTFTSTGSTTHSSTLYLDCGTPYTIYCRCADAGGNANPSSTAISFSIASPPGITMKGLGGGSASGGKKQ